VSDFVVGLTGGIGSGKSTVADFFAARQIAVIDTDQIAHALTAPSGQAMPAILAAFGPEMATPEGALDRAAMRRRVFADVGARKRLEGILHPLITCEARQLSAVATSDYVVVAIPLLVETGGWRPFCDRVLVIDCPEDLQITRVMSRNALTADEIRAILAAQASRSERLAAADDVLVNDRDPLTLAAAVEQLHRRYLAMGQAKKLHATH